MQHRARKLLLVILLVLGATPLQGQRTEVVRRTPGDTIGNSYRVHEPTGTPQGLLVLLPGYGSDVDGFAASSYTPSMLPARMAEQNVLTIVAVPDAETLYASDQPLHVLDSIIAEVLKKYRIPNDRVVVGGFSSGGAGAVRYAQFCARGRCKATPKVAGIFGVDPPLDFERLYRSSEVIIQRNAPRSNIAEERMIVEGLRQALGGTPKQAAEAYRRQSPLIASIPDGGNAQLLTTTPIRLYTEPDVHWWMENRNLDYHGINAVDHAALINLLRVAGNTRAELITTAGKGYRPNGTQHPHSWSIVDEADLAQWASGLLGVSRPDAQTARPSRQEAGADSAAIRRAALDYIEGWYTGNSERMQRALHPDLAKRAVDTDKQGRNRLIVMSADELTRATRLEMGTDVPPERRWSRVEILDIDGDLASVKLHSTKLIDYMHLARWDGEWKIVNVLWDARPEDRARP